MEIKFTACSLAKILRNATFFSQFGNYVIQAEYMFTELLLGSLECPFAKLQNLFNVDIVGGGGWVAGGL